MGRFVVGIVNEERLLFLLLIPALFPSFTSSSFSSFPPPPLKDPYFLSLASLMLFILFAINYHKKHLLDSVHYRSTSLLLPSPLHLLPPFLLSISSPFLSFLSLFPFLSPFPSFSYVIFIFSLSLFPGSSTMASS